MTTTYGKRAKGFSFSYFLSRLFLSRLILILLQFLQTISLEVVPVVVRLHVALDGERSLVLAKQDLHQNVVRLVAIEHKLKVGGIGVIL